MIFVPLPLFATFMLAAALFWFVAHRDMSQRPHRLFAGLLLTYCIQSLLLCLRWGYGLSVLQVPTALLAPLLPAMAWMAYQSLSGGWARATWLPAVSIGATWLTLIVQRELADLVILLSYFGFGALLVVQSAKGEAGLPLSPVVQVGQIRQAMGITGAILILSGLMDIFVIYDFVRNDGQHVGAAVAWAQVAFVLVIGVSATVGRASGTSNVEVGFANETEATTEDADILARLETLFATGLHRDEDLSLRKIARRLGVPDRRVSNAINRERKMNVSQFINEYRIKDACERLTATEESIIQISMAVGFASKSNFNREFVRIVGMTPSRWRAQPKTAASVSH